MSALIRAQNLGKSFGNQPVFQSVSFEIQPRQHLALLGSSGGGKSTLLRLLAGLDAPTQGQLWIDDCLVSESERIVVPPHERKLAMVFQDLALWPTLTALENVLLGLAQVCLSKAQKRERGLDCLRMCKVGALADRKPATLSIGQQQRVALARAIAVRPRLLLLDEPFSSLDPSVKAELLVEVQTLVDEFDMALVLVTHDPIEALAICQQGLVIEDGVTQESGDIRSMFAAPRSNFLCACVRQIRSVSNFSAGD